jgi:DNA processing protein
MIDALLGDADAVEAVHRLRPEGELTDALARVAWSVVAEPGDGVAGALIAQLGAADALRFAMGSERMRLDGTQSIGTGDGASPRAQRALHEGRQRWTPRASVTAVKDALRGAEEVSARLILPEDQAWPRSVNDLDEHRPVLLWIRGEARHLVAQQSVAMVGARAASSYGEHVAAELAGDLATTGTLVVSGGAYGIDATAHRAALGVGAATVAFLAGGVDRAYPRGHQQLFERIAEAGAVVSEVPCGTAPTKWRFLAQKVKL